MDAPQAGATIGPTTIVCLEVAGPTREPEVAFDVGVFPEGSTSAAVTIRVDGSVGRGSVEVDLAQVDPGRYDLQVQLIADGAPIDGVSVRVPSLTWSLEAPPSTCA